MFGGKTQIGHRCRRRRGEKQQAKRSRGGWGRTEEE